MKRPSPPPPYLELLGQLAGDRFSSLVPFFGSPTVDGRYFYWDDLRYRNPPGDLSREEWWIALKGARMQNRRALPFNDVEAAPFTYMITDEALAMLHRIDRFASGRISVPEAITNEATRNRYLVSSLMEEAIASSLLEGAATTRKDAKQLLRSGRKPRTTGEQMVYNNYVTMQMIRNNLDAPLTVDMILDIHRTVTEGTLHDESDAGRMQTPGEVRVDIGDPFDEAIVFHQPPAAEDLPELMIDLVTFANELETEPFVHPVVRAVAMHFMLAYIHPFVDGNGRTARALFYRSMLRSGYWLIEFVSISRLLIQAPAKYGMSFLHTEIDDADFTYFLLYQLGIVCRAIDELFDYLETRVREVRDVEAVLRGTQGLNHRQYSLLSDAVVSPDAVYTIASHQNSHGVVYQTARLDLLDLEALGYLERQVVGREYRFRPAPDLGERLMAAGKGNAINQ